MAENYPCPRCGAELPTRAQWCWLCGVPLEPGPADHGPFSSPRAALSPYQAQPAPDARDRPVPSLTAIFLGLGLVAVIAGSFLFSPGIGILLGICAVPLFVSLFGRRNPDVTGAPSTHDRAISSAGSKVAAILLGVFGSLFLATAIVPVMLLASIIAFFSICFGADSEATYQSIMWQAVWYLGVPAAIMLVLAVLAVRSN